MLAVVIWLEQLGQMTDDLHVLKSSSCHHYYQHHLLLQQTQKALTLWCQLTQVVL